MGGRGVETRVDPRIDPDGEGVEQQPRADLPEDVATLFRWAGLPEMRYRDYSASRREHRAQTLQRAALDLRERALRAQAEAETEAAIAEQMALAAEARSRDVEAGQQLRERSLLVAAEARRRVGTAREQAARHAEAAAQAGADALLQAREVAEASESAQRQAESYAQRGLHPQAGTELRKLVTSVQMEAPPSRVVLGAGGEERARAAQALPTFDTRDWTDGRHESWEAAYLASELSREPGALRTAAGEGAGLERVGLEPPVAERPVSEPPVSERRGPAWLYASPALAWGPGDTDAGAKVSANSHAAAQGVSSKDDPPGREP